MKGGSLTLEAVAGTRLPGDRHLERDIEEHVEVSRDPFCGPLREPPQLADVEPPSVALVGEERGCEAVAHDVLALEQGAPDHVVDVLGAVRRQQERLGLRV